MRKLLALAALVAIIVLMLVQFGPQFVFNNEPVHPSSARVGAR